MQIPPETLFVISRVVSISDHHLHTHNSPLSSADISARFFLLRRRFRILLTLDIVRQMQFIKSEKWLFIGLVINCGEKEEKWAEAGGGFLHNPFPTFMHSTIESGRAFSRLLSRRSKWDWALGNYLVIHFSQAAAPLASIWLITLAD